MADWIDVVEAWERIAAAVRPLAAERIPITAASGRVLREAVIVDRDLPAFDRAAMDGFAVQAAATRGAARDAPVESVVAGESLPGAPFAGRVIAGSVVRIMTGAPVPPDCDAIVPVEQTSGFGTPRVALYTAAVPGQHVTPRASERCAGEVWLQPGKCLQAVDIGALATVGVTVVAVGRQPRVAVLTTGNELVPHTERPGPAQIRDANGPMVVALAAAHTSQVVGLGTAPDDLESLRQSIRRGLECEALLISGGASMGAYDFVARALVAEGVMLHFTQVALQPGKPTLFGTHAGGLVLALPGNPVSSFTTFRLFAAPALRLQQGESAVRPLWSRAVAGFAWQRQHTKWLLLPGRRVEVGDESRVERVPYAGSGDLLALARADCQIVLSPDRKRVEVGDPVPVWPW